MVVFVTNDAYSKLYNYGVEMKKKGEIGGLIGGEVTEDGDIFIDKVILLKQVMTSGTFEIDDEALSDFTKNASAEELQSILGWWHSHGASFTGDFSLVDDECFKRLCNLSNICVGILITFDKKFKDMKVTARVDVLTKTNGYISIDHVDPEIENGKINLINVTDEVTTNVTKDTRHPQAFFKGVFKNKRCWRCWGDGFIWRKNKRIPCPECATIKGKKNHQRNVNPCSQCGGSGYTVMFGALCTCPRCGGVGVIDNEYIDYMF